MPDPEPCRTCGQVHTRCTAHRKHTDPPEPCNKRPIRGLKVCYNHGGASVRARTAGQARVAEQAVEDDLRRQLVRLSVTPIADPLTELQTLAGQVVAWKNAIAQRVNQLTAIRFEDRRGAEQIRSEVVLFERAMDRCTAVLTAMAKLNIDERLLALDERRATLVATVLNGVLDEIGLSAEQQRDVKTRFARQLRVVSGGQP